jgi:4'-phosphopantetheinyl transferase
MMVATQSRLLLEEVSPERLQLQEYEFLEFSNRPIITDLECNDVHVWFARAQGQSSQIAIYKTLLSSDELDRTARFRFERDREAFAFAHGVLRNLLGAYLHVPAMDLRFDYSKHGKPSVFVPANADIQFNLSHTAGAVLIGICRNREIGVDIEKVRNDFELMDIAARFFTLNERETLLCLPEPERPQAFFHCWTRKEAVLKARGDGLSFPLDHVEVSVTPEEAIVGLETSEARRWRILPLNVPAGYAAAMALSQR